MVTKKGLAIFGSVLFMALTTAACTGGKTNSSSHTDDLEIDTRELNAKDYAFANLCGEDALGRTIERIDREKSVKKYVGVFYSMWLGQHMSSQTDAYNITTLEMTEEGRAALYSTTNNELSRMNEFHFWGEPLYGYYNTRDPWVLTRHMELFLNAGVDYVCIDATNSVLYVDATNTLLELLLKWTEEGYKVPKVMFYTNSYSGTTVQRIYNEWYQTERYNSVWFAPHGKPMIIGLTERNRGASDQWNDTKLRDIISDELIEFFDVKESEWPNGQHNENSIPWMSWDYPQRTHKGSIAIPVAQHSHTRISVSYKDPESHRGYNNVTQQVEGDADSGLSFQQMWDTALNENYGVTNALVCSFNEWMAIKYKGADGKPYFVDVFDYEYSRDMEMMKGGYGDNYYLQLVENIRKFKYEPYVQYKKDLYNIDIENGVDSIWDIVTAQYQDLSRDAINRNFVGAVSKIKYIDNSARNDIDIVKVTNNENKLFFYVQCLEDITERNLDDEKFMNILLKTKNSDKNFAGFNYVINRHLNENGKATIERCTGDYNWEVVGEADISINGKVMQIAIPREAIEVNENCDVEFKVTDNITHPEDIMDYYVSGDSMPLGRMRYGY